MENNMSDATDLPEESRQSDVNSINMADESDEELDSKPELEDKSNSPPLKENDDSPSRLFVLRNKKDNRSDFDKAFEDDTLYELQNRMLAKAGTKKFTTEDFIHHAEDDFKNKTEILEYDVDDDMDEHLK